MIIGLLKMPVFLIVLFGHIIVSLAGDLFIRDENRRRKFFTYITSRSSRLGLRVLNIRISAINLESYLSTRKPVLLVANHLSYLDILILSSLNPSLYITSVEVEKTFFLGMISRLGGSLFVERRSKGKLLEEVDRIADIMRQGFTVTLFPEGTSSDGEKVLPFKGALLKTAEKAGVDIFPVCIKYRSINGAPPGPNNRDLAYYYGDIRFFPHLMKLFFVKRIDVTVTFLRKIPVVNRERKEITDEVFELISSTYSEPL